jgi:hypothetical protein
LLGAEGLESLQGLKGLVEDFEAVDAGDHNRRRQTQDIRLAAAFFFGADRSRDQAKRLAEPAMSERSESSGGGGNRAESQIAEFSADFSSSLLRDQTISQTATFLTIWQRWLQFGVRRPSVNIHPRLPLAPSRIALIYRGGCGVFGRVAAESRSRNAPALPSIQPLIAD